MKCRKDAENIDQKISSSSNGRAMIWSKCAICGSKKSRFIKNQDAKGLLSNLGIKTLLSKVPILGDILFWMQFHWMCMLTCIRTCLKHTICKQHIKINEILNKFLLAGDKFMPQMHLKQPGFMYSACGPFHLLKTKKEFKNLKKQEIQAVFIKMNLITLVFNMIWIMEILKI